MGNGRNFEVVTVADAEKTLQLTHAETVLLIVDQSLKWVSVEGATRVELPKSRRERQKLVKRAGEYSNGGSSPQNEEQ